MKRPQPSPRGSASIRAKSARPAAIRRILVPLDFSRPSPPPLHVARDWALRLGAEIRLLHVVEPVFAAGAFGPVPMGRTQHGARRHALRLLEELARTRLPATVPVSLEVRRGLPFEQIVAAARDGKADLIVLATRGRSGLRQALLGGTTDRVVRLAPCPVLTFHPAKRRKA